MPDAAEKPATFRLFVAITVPQEVKAPILKTQDRLRKLLPGSAARWATPEQFHLTLRFLGNIQVSQVEALDSALRAACAGFGALPLRASHVGFFPRPHAPRVVWVGVDDDQDRLPKLWSAVQSATHPFTMEQPEEKFVGHITLARIKSIRPRDAQVLAEHADKVADEVFGDWAATEVEIIRSQLSPQGARYSTLKSVPLLAH